MSVSQKRGFTLIELLVVIAIIAILAAILFPVFAKAREKARQITCASNEKQVGLAFLQYVEDYDEVWPVGLAGTGANKIEGVGWAGQIYAYVKSTGVLKCPDDSTQPVTGTPVLYPVSYAYNSDAAAESDAGFSAPSSTVVLAEVTGDTADVTDPAEGAQTYDSSAGNGDSLTNLATGAAQTTLSVTYVTGPIEGAFGTTAPDTVSAPYSVATGLHTGGSNYLLADGHVKWYVGQKVSGGTTASSPTYTGTYAGGVADGTASTNYAITFSPT